VAGRLVQRQQPNAYDLWCGQPTGDYGSGVAAPATAERSPMVEIQQAGDRAWPRCKVEEHDGQQASSIQAKASKCEEEDFLGPSVASRLHGFVPAFLSSTVRHECPADAQCGASGLWQGGGRHGSTKCPIAARRDANGLQWHDAKCP
jgi:hypothetical protein